MNGPDEPNTRDAPEEGSDVRRIEVGALTRVEGEGALRVRVAGERVEEVALQIYEPPRFFEALLQGRGYTEPPDITARICGICPVAYQMSACHALEAICGVRVDGPLRDLRRLLYCGEWIESHALHIHLLHAPDFLGYPSGIALAADHPAEVERGLRLKKIGNQVMTLLGGREIHPVNVRLGGFYRVPSRAELQTLREPLLQARDDALAVVAWVAGFPFPELELEVPMMAMVSEREYPMNEGRLASTGGLDFTADTFEEHVEELHLTRSTALHARLNGEPYLVGPLARFALNEARLGEPAREAARAAGLRAPERNPFRSIVVRAVEVVQACDDALAIVEAYEPPDAPAVAVPPRAGRGAACTEAPRGTLYHRYTLDEDGTVLDARIVPPTAQSQSAIETDVRGVVERNLAAPHEALRHLCEQAIRNHDPCISCATHFLDLEIERGSAA